jgi:homoserine kinase
MVASEHIDNLLKHGRKITIQIPGCTSNLGPGLDCVGLALKIYSRMSFFVLDKNDPRIPLINFKGSIAKSSLAQDQGKLTYTLLSRLWKQDNELLQRVRILVESELPLGVGLGSSATAILGALWASNVLQDRVPTEEGLLAEAAAIEGHLEALAACLLGDFVISGRGSDGKKVLTQKLHWPEQWHVLLVSPSYSLNTKMSREVLPKQVKLEDALHNVQKVAQLVAAISRADDEALKEAFNDRLHEPYRCQLVPELNKLKRELIYEPILGCVLSGAGSSVAIFVHERHKAVVLERLEHWARGEQKLPKILDLRVDRQGIQQLEP